MVDVEVSGVTWQLGHVVEAGSGEAEDGQEGAGLQGEMYQPRQEENIFLRVIEIQNILRSVVNLP